MVVEQDSNLMCMCMVFSVWFCLHTWGAGLSVGQFLLKNGHLCLLLGWKAKTLQLSLKSTQITGDI